MGTLLAIVALGFVLYEVYNGMGVDTSNWPAAPNAQVGALAVAIATAEDSGATNNPGSLGAGDVSSDEIVSQFNDAGVVNIDTLSNGVNALYAKLQNIQDGNSDVYSLDMTISEFANLYTGGDNADAWASSVANSLGVTADTTLGQVLNG